MQNSFCPFVSPLDNELSKGYLVFEEIKKKKKKLESMNHHLEFENDVWGCIGPCSCDIFLVLGFVVRLAMDVLY